MFFILGNDSNIAKIRSNDLIHLCECLICGADERSYIEIDCFWAYRVYYNKTMTVEQAYNKCIKYIEQ